MPLQRLLATLRKAAPPRTNAAILVVPLERPIRTYLHSQSWDLVKPRSDRIGSTDRGDFRFVLKAAVVEGGWVAVGPTRTERRQRREARMH